MVLRLGHVLLFSVGVDLVGSCTRGDGVIGCVVRQVAFGNKCCIMGKAFDVMGP